MADTGAFKVHHVINRTICAPPCSSPSQWLTLLSPRLPRWEDWFHPHLRVLPSTPHLPSNSTSCGSLVFIHFFPLLLAPLWFSPLLALALSLSPSQITVILLNSTLTSGPTCSSPVSTLIFIIQKYDHVYPIWNTLIKPHYPQNAVLNTTHHIFHYLTSAYLSNFTEWQLPTLFSIIQTVLIAVLPVKNVYYCLWDFALLVEMFFCCLLSILFPNSTFLQFPAVFLLTLPWHPTSVLVSLKHTPLGCPTYLKL